MKKTFFFLIIAGIGFLHGQDIRDALRFSGNELSGTARTMGMAGTSVALGGDFGTLTSNPAGIGMNQYSYFMLSPSLQIVSSSTNYLDNTTTANRSGFGFSNIGLIVRSRTEGENLKSFNFAIGYNQLSNFSRKIHASGFNKYNSFSYFLASAANGINYFDINQNDYYYPYIAWYSLAIDTMPGQSSLYQGVAKNNVQQDIVQDIRGRVGEWTLAFAGNFSNRLFLGLGIGIRSLSYTYENAYLEEDIQNIHQTYNPSNGEYDFQKLGFYETIYGKGTGINASLGAIIHPTDYLRIGISLKSPTVTNVRETFQASIDPMQYDNGDSYTKTTLQFSNSYRLINSYEARFGALILFEKTGILQFEAGIKDYTQTRFEARGTSGSTAFSQLNREISDFLQFSYSLRGGGEIKLDNFYIRAGYAYISGALNEQGQIYYDLQGDAQKLDIAQHIVSAGIGYRINNVFFDVAFLRQMQKDKFLPYSIDFNRYPNLQPLPTAVSSINLNDIVFTLGFRL